ncbi:acetyltransferase [Neisseria sp.]|uniref:acetyltransferase n=1 Tax=Neisseria sp. TaxID=192066 RepID=UPI0035A02111
MNKKLAIIGAGGHAKVVLDTALLMNRWTSIVFLDDFHNGKTEFMGFPLLGSCNLLGLHIKPDEYDIALGLGGNDIRARRLIEAEQLGFRLPCIVHPTAVVSRFAEIGAGTVLFAHSAVNAGATVGKGVIINTSATIDHDCELADFVHISPGVHLAGNTRVGTFSWLGIGSCTRQGTVIGAGCTVGAGSAIVKDIPDGVTAVGVPARIKM